MYAADGVWHGDSLRLKRTIGCPHCADAPGNRTVSPKPTLQRITQTATFCYFRESPPEPAPRTYSLFLEDRCEGLLPDESIVRLKLKALQLHRPRQWGACWLALNLWQTLDLDVFWAERLPPSRKGTRWDLVLFVLAAYRLIAPGSEWRLHREWYGRTALADLLGSDDTLADPHVLYECHDRLLAHKEALFTHLTGRWRGPVQRLLRSAAVRPDEHLLRVRS